MYLILPIKKRTTLFLQFTGRFNRCSSWSQSFLHSNNSLRLILRWLLQPTRTVHALTALLFSDTVSNQNLIVNQ